MSVLADSVQSGATHLLQTTSPELLSEGVEAMDRSALDSLSFDSSWPLSSNDPKWDFVVNQDGGSDAAQQHLDLPTLAASTSSMPGRTGDEQCSINEETLGPTHSIQESTFPAPTTLGQADVFFTIPRQQQTMFLLESPTPRGSSKGKGIVSEAASPQCSSGLSTTLVPSTRSAVSTPCSVPGEDSFGEFMYHLMNLRVPDVKKVIFVQQSGLFAAVMDNTLAIGVSNGPEAIFDDETGSPFNRDWIESRGSMQLAQIRSKFSSAPRDLQPVDVQITVEHHVYLDVIPFPSFRERALKAIAHDPPLLDEDELCCDICSREGLIVWGSQGNDRGMEAGRPWDMRSWEPKPWFLRKYDFLVGGWDDEMWRAARWWHMMRNERISVGPVSWATSK